MQSFQPYKQKPLRYARLAPASIRGVAKRCVFYSESYTKSLVQVNLDWLVTGNHIVKPTATLLGVLALALAAQLSVPLPGTHVPQSAQTLAVVLVGALLGPVGGGLSVLCYLLAGALGLPVFADGAGGWRHLLGPTAGYLVGFFLAAVLMGWGVRSPWAVGRGLARIGLVTAVLALLAHGVILGAGWLRLAVLLGPAAAWERGAAPFLLGAVVKSVLAAGVWVVWLKSCDPRRKPG